MMWWAMILNRRTCPKIDAHAHPYKRVEKENRIHTACALGRNARGCQVAFVSTSPTSQRVYCEPMRVEYTDIGRGRMLQNVMIQQQKRE